MMKYRHFTFLEIIAAVMILAMSLAAVLTVVGGSRSRLMRGERRWARQHVLTSATEFYLLAGHDALVPAELLPEGFSAECVLEAVEDLPDHAAESYNGWVLGRYTVTVYNAGGETVGQQVVEKIVLEEDL